MRNSILQKHNLKGQTYCEDQEHIVICDGLCDNCPAHSSPFIGKQSEEK
jgi:hypothetical protein